MELSLRKRAGLVTGLTLSQLINDSGWNPNPNPNPDPNEVAKGKPEDPMAALIALLQKA